MNERATKRKREQNLALTNQRTQCRTLCSRWRDAAAGWLAVCFEQGKAIEHVKQRELTSDLRGWLTSRSDES